MTMTDPVADFLTRLRNAARAQKETVAIPSSRLKRELARILAEQGYIEGFRVEPSIHGRAGEQLVLRLKYTEDRRPVITGARSSVYFRCTRSTSPTWPGSVS